MRQHHVTTAATLLEYLALWATTRGRTIAIRHKSLGVWDAWTWSDLLAEVGRIAAALEPRDVAPGNVVIVASAASPRWVATALATQALGGEALVAAARGWVGSNRIEARDQVFLSDAPTTDGAPILIASWLVSGATLILPEDATTVDTDRREAQPTLVAATAAGYEQLRQRVDDNLPAPGTWLRAAVNAGLASATRSGAPRVLGAWLIRRPLREVLGLGHAAVAVVLDEAPLTAGLRELFTQLGVSLRTLIGDPRAEISAAPAPLFAPDADAAPVFEPVLTFSPSPSAPVGKLT